MVKKEKPTKTKEKVLRDHPITGKALKNFEAMVEYASKNTLGSKDTLLEEYYKAWEADDDFGNQIRKFKPDDETAQRWVVDKVKSGLGRVVTKPVYGCTFMPVCIRNEVQVDEKTGRKTPIYTSFGLIKLKSLKTGAVMTEMIGDLHAYGSDISKVEDMGVNKIYSLTASCSNTNARVLYLSVDDRCEEAKPSQEKMKSFDSVLSSLFPLESIKKIYKTPSADKSDLKHIEGSIKFIQFPKGKNYAILEITDDSVSLDMIEKMKSKANLRVLISKELVMRFGKESIVKILGQVKKESTPEYGDSITMLFPSMIHGVLVIPPETGSAGDDDDEGTDPKTYFDGKAKEDESRYDTEKEDDDDDEEDEDDEDDEDEEEEEEEEDDDDDDEEDDE